MSSNKSKVSIYMVFIVAGLFLVIISPFLLGQGMFMDGAFYASVSLNMAEGWGDFWHLHFSKTYMSEFHEHPPLAFWLQSIFYRIFGDSTLVEKFYSLLTYVISGVLVAAIWRRIFSSDKKNLFWFPLLLWLSIPLNHWSVCQNMLENTMMIFILLSVLLMLLAIGRNRVFFMILAGAAIFLAALTKGFVAFFPLSVPLFIMIYKGYNFKRFFIDELLIILGLIIPLSIVVFLIPDAKESLLAYLNKQVIGSIQNVVTVESRFYIVWRAFTELIPALLIAIITFLIYRKKVNRTFQFSDSRIAIAFLLIGLSGILPIMVSMKQRGFYIIPAFPFLAISLAILMSDFALVVQVYFKENIRARVNLMKASMIVLAIGVSMNITTIGKINYDEAMVKDTNELLRFLPEQSTISCDPTLFGEWSLRAYLYRKGRINYVTDGEPLKYHLVPKSNNFKDSAYKPENLNLEKFKLYTRTE